MLINVINETDLKGGPNSWGFPAYNIRKGVLDKEF